MERASVQRADSLERRATVEGCENSAMLRAWTHPGKDGKHFYDFEYNFRQLR
jgi:hypothetical protein